MFPSYNNQSKSTDWFYMIGTLVVKGLKWWNLSIIYKISLVLELLTIILTGHHLRMITIDQKISSTPVTGGYLSLCKLYYRVKKMLGLLVIIPENNMKNLPSRYLPAQGECRPGKVNNKDTRATPEWRQKRLEWRRSGVFIVNFEHISHLILVFLLLTLSR